MTLAVLARNSCVLPYVLPDVADHRERWVSPEPARGSSPDPRGAPLTRTNFSHHGTRLRKAAGAPGVRFHDLRYLSASRAATVAETARELMQLLGVLDDVAVPTGSRPRSRPATLVADKAYFHPSTRKALRRRQVRPVIPECSDQKARSTARGSSLGRPPQFDAEISNRRNVVERAFGRLEQGRGIATHYDKHARNYRAGIVVCWLR